jgi:hypothetical protein
MMPAEAIVLPTSEQLDLFFDLLRRAEFKVGPNEIAAAQKILLLAHAEADDGLAARRLKTMLAPIVVRTPTQQADFYRRFDALIADIAPAPADDQRMQAGRTIGQPAAASAAAPPGMRSRRAVIAAAVAALLLTIAAEVWLLWPPPPQPPRAPPSAKPSPTIADVTGWVDPPPSFVTATLVRRAGYQVARVGAIALPLLLFAGWMLWRWRRRALWLERHSGVRKADPAVVRLPEQHQPLFPAADLTAIALDLRRHLRVPSRDLDVERTIPQTLDAGGSFTPVWQTVPRSPNYLFLIEKESAHDHVAGIFDQAVDRLVGEDVAVERYHFRDDPRWLIGNDRSRGIEPIADVAARYGDHRLVILAGADGMFEPLRDRLEPGVEQALAQWTPRAVLSTKPMQSWSWRELALRDLGGFDVATASHSGLRALAARAAAEPDRPAELLEGVVVSMPARPSLTRRESGPASAPSPRPGRKSALLICVGGAEDAEAEIRRLSSLLEHKAGFSVQVLPDPDRRRMVEALEFLVRTNYASDDTILIHFYGRFAPGSDGAIFLGSGEGLEMPAFAGLLNQSSAGRQILVVDGVMYDGALFQDSDTSAVPRGLAWDSSSPSTRKLEVVWARGLQRPKSEAETEVANGLTGLLVDTVEQDLTPIEAAMPIDVPFLVDLVRKRASRFGILDDLNLHYFTSAPTLEVMAGTVPHPDTTKMEPGAVFISYAREDQAAARRLCDFLEKEAGIDVWLDSRQLSPGEDWYDESRRHIDNCSFFIPVISAEAVRRQDGLFRREWAWATERAVRIAGAVPFIIPVIIDDTSANADGIPDEFRRVGWAQLRGGVGDEAFRDRMRSLVADNLGRLSDYPSRLTLWIISAFEVDQRSIQKAFGQFGNDWPIPEVMWPNSANDLVGVLRRALEQLDHAAGLIGVDRFSAEVPPVLTRIPDDRQRAAANIPGMVRRLRGLEQRHRVAAVTSFLLCANVKIHYSAVYQAGWTGLGVLGLQAPPDWVALLDGLPDPVGFVLGKRGDGVIQVRLRRVGGVDIAVGDSPGLYITVPERFAAKITSRPYELPLDQLYWWAIPQLEFAAAAVNRLPDAYSRDWYFDKIGGD